MVCTHDSMGMGPKAEQYMAPHIIQTKVLIVQGAQTVSMATILEILTNTCTCSTLTKPQFTTSNSPLSTETLKGMGRGPSQPYSI